MKKTIGSLNNNNLFLTIGSYSNNGRIYIGIETVDDLYADATINLTDLEIQSENNIFLNSDISKELRNILKEKGIIGDTIETYQYNMGRYDMVLVDFDVLKEYDPEGFKQYNKKDELEI